jgi:hypothetical protein
VLSLRKRAPNGALFHSATKNKYADLALARFKARVLFVNHVKTSTTTNYTAMFITLFCGFQGAKNFHNGRLSLIFFKRKRFLRSFGQGVKA